MLTKLLIKVIPFVLICMVLCTGLFANEKLKVGVVDTLGTIKMCGGTGILKALEKENDIDASIIKRKNINLDFLLNYDVLIFGSSPKGISDDMVDKIKNYVKCGGGILMLHNSCGFLGWEPLFPEIGQGASRIVKKLLRPLETKHPVLNKLPKEFPHAYYDHIALLAGPEAQLLIEDENHNPVLVSGKLKYGRILLNGAITGFSADGKETPPTGGERQLLLNTVRWLGAKPVTAISKDMIKARKIEIEYPYLKDKIAEYEKAKTKWFYDDLLRYTYLERPPVETLNGKYVLIARAQFLNGFGYDRARQNLRQLKQMGITDILQLTMMNMVAFHPMTNPDARPIKYSKNSIISKNIGDYDPFMILLEAASKENINVWIKIQITAGKITKKKAHACDSKGKPLYGWGGKQPVVDILSRNYRNFLFRMIDEYAERYTKYGNLKGFNVDMPWNPACNDSFGDDSDAFNQFCMKNFGEPIPVGIEKKMDLGSKWDVPTDKWWRRYMLFKQWATEDFYQSLNDYVRKKGFGFSLQVQPFAHLTNGWYKGFNTYKLLKLADWIWAYPGSRKGLNDMEACYVYKNCYSAHGSHRSWGRCHALSFRGNDGGLNYFFNQFWKPYKAGFTPRLTRELKKHIINSKEWTGAKSLAKVAILHNENNLFLRLGKKTPVENAKEVLIFDRLSYYQDVDRLLIESTENYKNYKVLLAPAYSVGGLSEDIMKALKEYVNNGGTVISLGARWSISNPDLTDEKDLTGEISGRTSSNKKKKRVGRPEFKFYEKKIGKGRVVTVETANAVLEMIKKNDRKIEKEFADLVSEYSKPAITIEDIPNKARMKIVSALKKNNWVGISLFSDDHAPAYGKVYVDLKKLGLNKSGYRVLLLGKEMEFLKSRHYNGGIYGKEDFWKAEDFKNGINVNILPDSEMDLCLPDKFKFSSLDKESAEWLR